MAESSTRPRDIVQREFVAEWLAKAEQDLEAAKLLNAQQANFLALTGFHAQQAAEKFLKALLTHHQIEFPKTHDLEDLLELAERADRGIASSLSGVAPLSEYGVDARYPGGAEPSTRDEARQAIELAERVRDRVLSALPRPE